jgi:hypothetical protein
MLRNLGRLIWSQTRDMHVFNYPKAIVYEIRTSDGDMLIKYCKKTEEWSVDKRKSGDYGVMLKQPSQPETPDNTEPSCH